jgi:hypothetical protein
MLVTHLSSILFLPLIILQGYLTHRRRSVNNSDIHHRFFFREIVAGIVAGFVFFQLIFSLIAKTTLLFFWPQIQIASNVGISAQYSQPVKVLAQNSNYNIFTISIFIGCILYWLTFSVGPKVEHQYFVLYFLAFICALFIFMPLTLTLLLSRGILYSSFFYVVDFFALVGILGKVKIPSIKETQIIGVLIWVSLLFKVKLGSYLPPTISGIETWKICVLFGVIYFLASLVIHFAPNLGVLSLIILAICCLITPINFDGQPSIVKAHDKLESEIGKKLPKFFWNAVDRNVPTFDILTASFTEKAWWARGQLAPDCPRPDGGPLEVNDPIILLSTLSDFPANRVTLKQCFPKISFVSSFQESTATEKYVVGIYELK